MQSFKLINGGVAILLGVLLVALVLVRNSFLNFVKSCRTDFVKFFAIGRGAESLEVAVGKLPEVDSAFCLWFTAIFFLG